MEIHNIQQLFQDAWAIEVFGTSVGIWLSALFLLILGVAFRGFITRIVISRLDRLAKRTINTYDDEILERLRKPLEMLVLLAAIYLALSIIPFQADGKILVDKILNTVAIFAIFRGFLALVEPLMQLTEKMNHRLDKALIGWLTRIVRILVIILGGATIAEIWGIPVASIIAGLGLVGAAVALGAQDLFKNLISGIMIIAERRFEVGDWIKVDGVVEGTVESIGFRSTSVDRFDLGPVYVPNANLADNPMVNFSRRDKRRITMTIGLLSHTSVEALEQIRDETRAWINDHPRIVNPDQISTFVNVDSFQDSSIGLMIYCFTTTTVWGEWLDIKEELIFALKSIVKNAGSDFAYPSRSLYFHHPIHAGESHTAPPPTES